MVQYTFHPQPHAELELQMQTGSSVCLIVSSGPAAPASALVCVFHMMHIGLDMHGIKIPSCMLSQCCICTSDGVSVCVLGQTTVIDIVLARPVFLDSLRATLCLTARRRAVPNLKKTRR
jgi:hypothetical protein